MGMYSRRRVIGGGLAFAGAATGGPLRAASGAAEAQLTIDPRRTLNHLPPSYNGFSIEQATLEDPDIYHAGNRSLVALFRRLTTNGILRIGGNSSEFCWWKGTPDTPQPVMSASGQGRADNWMPRAFHPITPRAIDNLRTFLDATGWRCIYGLNLGVGTPERDAEEAAYVAQALGPTLLYFQIGNEPDLYRREHNKLRPAEWDYPDYLREWTAIARAVLARQPQARFAGPDVAGARNWLLRFARDAKPLVGDHIAELTGHYYAEGPPSSPEANIANLLETDPHIARSMDSIMPIAREAGLAYRLSEGNSCYRGGKAGMSNAFASALWGMDFMLDMGARGCTGINLHGGGGSVISSALGGKLPGARNAHDLEVAKLGTFYSPVAGNPKRGYEARPIFYGMMAVEMFAGSRLVATQLDAGGANVTAYAGVAGDHWSIALINKDLSRDVEVQVALPAYARAASLWRLTGPAPDATEDVRFAHAAVAPGTAAWTPQPEKLASVGKSALVSLTRASAIVLSLA